MNMATRIRKPDWSRVLAKLRRGVSVGDTAAIAELGLTLLEGISDREGRSLVRRNSAYAIRLLRRAAQSGDATAAASLGYAYDVGAGTRHNAPLALKWYRRAARMGETLAAANIATLYRDQGNLRRAHRWVLRATSMGDGDAAVTAGYGCLYGIGVRRDADSARRWFRRAVLATDITAYGREEALYHWAVAELDHGNRRRAIPLLQRANGDDDYPEAKALLAQIIARTEPNPCRCRRHLYKHLRGHAKCPQHPQYSQ